MEALNLLSYVALTQETAEKEFNGAKNKKGKKRKVKVQSVKAAKPFQDKALKTNIPSPKGEKLNDSTVPIKKWLALQESKQALSSQKGKLRSKQLRFHQKPLLKSWILVQHLFLDLSVEDPLYRI